MIIVPCDTPGFNLVRNIPVMGHSGAGYFSHGEILYQSCRVPVENLLGPEGHGFVIAQDRLGPGRIHHCMRWIGICNRAFDLMCSRASQRIISPDQKTRDKADNTVVIAESGGDSGRGLMTLHAAWKIENTARKRRATISRLSSLSWQYDAARDRQGAAVHGGMGMTDDTILAFSSARAREDLRQGRRGNKMNVANF